MSTKMQVRGGRKGGFGGQKKPSLETLRAGQAACFFREYTPPIIREEIEQVERDLWNRVQAMDMETVKAEVEEWLMDLGTTIGRLSAYEWIITTHWVTKKLVAHVLMDRGNKDLGDKEPVKAWKEFLP